MTTYKTGSPCHEYFHFSIPSVVCFVVEKMKLSFCLRCPELHAHSAMVETFFPAPFKPNFLIVLRSQPTVGPSSILLLVSIKKEAVSGRGANLLASRSAASSS